MIIQRLLLALLILSSGLGAGAALRLPAIINDHMVLQRNAQPKFWGWAGAGSTVSVRTSWNGKTVTATADSSGKWLATLATGEAGGPHEIEVRADGDVRVIRDVLLGEVWLASGQSNMNVALKFAQDAEQEIAAANYPTIRFFTADWAVADEPQADTRGRWQACTPAVTEGFSAVGYFFARELQREYGVPVGMIRSAYGGTPIESWTRAEVLRSSADYRPILERFKAAVKVFPETQKKFEQEMEKWQALPEEAKAKLTPPRPVPPLGPGHRFTPSGLYNAMIHPLIPFTVKGVIWYQGESNAERAYQYRTLFPAMITDWREQWQVPNMPFLFVQLANFKARKDQPGESSWAELREAQAMTLRLPHTAMATTIDIGDAKNIHPLNKQDVAKRLFLAAQNRVYGKPVEYSGPTYAAMEIKDGKARVSLDHSRSGLKTRDGAPVTGFAIAGQDRRFFWARAEIVGSSVVVSSPEVPSPVAVRYAWADNPDCNLYNAEGLPAVPFRTDDWPGLTTNKF